MVRVRNLLLGARLLELGGAELGVMRLGMHGVRREMPERLVHAMNVQLVLHCLLESEVALQKKVRNFWLRFWRTTWLTPL